MGVISLEKLLEDNGWEIKPSPPDGHCLLHSVITSWGSQLPDLPPISLAALKSNIRREVMSNIDEYLGFRFNKIKLLDQMERYIKYRKFNSDFGDLVPLILAKYLNVLIRILDTDSSDMVREHLVDPANCNLSIVIQRRGDHFNGIIPSYNIGPLSTMVPVMHTLGPESMHDGPEITNESFDENAPLPYPWSLGPLPATTPLSTGLAILVDTPKPRYERTTECELVASQSRTSNIFSRQALLELRDTVPCVLKRDVRKTFFRLNIWGRHHGCNLRPVTPLSMSFTRIQIRTTFRLNKRTKGIVHISDLIYPERQSDDLSIISPTAQIPVLITKRTPHSGDNVKPPPPILRPVQPSSPQSTKMFHVCLLNVRSFGDDRKAGRVRDFVEQEHLDCAVFTETWTKSDDTSAHQIGDITPTGFNFYHRPRCGRKGGGVGLLLKSNLKVKNLPHTSFQSFEHMQVSITASKAHINMLIIYRPPPSIKNKSTADQFFCEFGTLLEEITISPGKLLIMGDFNFHIDDTNNSQARRLLTCLIYLTSHSM